MCRSLSFLLTYFLSIYWFRLSWSALIRSYINVYLLGLEVMDYYFFFFLTLHLRLWLASSEDWLLCCCLESTGSSLLTSSARRKNSKPWPLSPGDKHLYINRYILTLIEVFLNQKRVNVCEHTVKMVPHVCTLPQSKARDLRV